jgi:hypothetical protein
MIIDGSSVDMVSKAKEYTLNYTWLNISKKITDIIKNVK